MTPDTRAELAELVEAALERRLDAAMLPRMEAILRGDRDAQMFYLRQMHLDASLRWDLGSAAEFRAVKRLKPAALPRRVRAKILKRMGLMLGVAAAVLLAVALMRSHTPPTPPTQQATALAVLTGVVDAEWEDNGAQPGVGARFTRETLRLRKGWARLEFASGASVSLEGPAELEIRSADRAFLRRGQLTANVPPRAIGFRVDTSELEVVDLGTSFGVAVEPSGTAEVCVFDGEVELSAHAATHRVREGASARLEAGQKEMRDVPYDAKRFERAWPITFGVLSATGAVRFVPPAPAQRPRRYRDARHLMVFPERESIRVSVRVKATINTAGWHHGPFEDKAVTVPPGTMVRSYLLQFFPGTPSKAEVHRLQGSLTFDRPIVALLATTSHLSASDAILGAEGSRHSEKARGIESGDAFELSADRRTLTLDWTAAAGVDQLRVLVAGSP